MHSFSAHSALQHLIQFNERSKDEVLLVSEEWLEKRRWLLVYCMVSCLAMQDRVSVVLSTRASSSSTNESTINRLNRAGFLDNTLRMNI